ncbi:Mg/Co/Ni transporter MgtE, CBS domain-containing [hydrothermal vent metagenome]|uniref:Mg/Co/Ni transporter MgtE, CBS domain-containing n=1 Tax=hydrothermal vent metagenome TaxID=652676 RepID=A0A3B1A0T1_9ZZZZ
MAEQSINSLNQLTHALLANDYEHVSRILQKLHSAEIAHIFEALTTSQREVAWPYVAPEQEGEILLHLNDEVRSSLIDNMDSNQLIAATETLDADELADILPEMPQEVINELLMSMEHQERTLLESVLLYDENTAGGLMDLNTVVVRADITLDVVSRYLRLRNKLPSGTDNLFVVNRNGTYLGNLPLIELLTNKPDLKVSDLIKTDNEAILASMPANEVALKFEQLDLISAPVVDDDNKLLGRITIDDIVDVIRDESDHSFMSMAGLNEDHDMFAPVLTSTRKRTLWLGINLLTAFLASWVIGHFSVALEKIVALAILMPIVASMGGIAGSQTLTLVIRGIALGQVGEINSKRLLQKELLVGIANGVIWSVVVAIIVGAWFDFPELSLIIAFAMMITLVFAAAAGAIIPITLNKVGADPALAGGVLLTTITDIVGFLTFLGIATIYLI